MSTDRVKETAAQVAASLGPVITDLELLEPSRLRRSSIYVLVNLKRSLENAVADAAEPARVPLPGEPLHTQLIRIVERIQAGLRLDVPPHEIKRAVLEMFENCESAARSGVAVAPKEQE
jgi:hypothetical protein